MSWKSGLRRVEPYVPGEQPSKKNIIKLNTNENPYPPAPGVRTVFDGHMADALRLYPDPEVKLLKNALAEYHGVDAGQVFVGVGSDDVIAMAFLTCFNSGRNILFPDITYSFYDVWAELFRIPYERVPVSDTFEILPEDYRRPNGGIVIANPNAPTGVFMPLCQIRDILEHNRESVVIVDEAYIDFGGESALTLVAEYDNLLVTRTYSKSRSMAGIRIGYAIGSRELVDAINAVKFSYNSYTMNTPSILAGIASIKDDAYFHEMLGRVMATREWTGKRLSELGFSFPESKANFIFATHATVSARHIFEELKQCDIYVRYFNKPRIDNYLRITIGTDEQMEKLTQALQRITGAG